jgi:hypothetical protein
VTYRDELQALHAQNESLRRDLDEARREVARLKALHALHASRDGQREGPQGGAGQSPSGHPDGINRTGVRLALTFGLAMVVMASLVTSRALVNRPAEMAWRYAPSHVRPCSHWVDDLHPGAYVPSVAGPRFVPVERTGRVRDVSGAASVAPGTRCDVWVTPTAHPEFNCRVEVRCGDTVVYGKPGAGYNHCAVEHGAPVRAHDVDPSSVDHDARLEMDLAVRSVVVSDEGATERFSIGLTLDPEP